MRAILAVLIGVVLTGCALKDRNIDIGYSSSYAGEQQGGEVDVRVVDDRVFPERIGVVENGFGIAMANVYPTKHVRVIVGDAVSQELEKRGVSVGSGEGDIVNIEVIRFHTEPTGMGFNFTSEGEFDVRVNDHAPERFTDEYIHGTTGFYVDLKKHYRIAFEGLLNKMIPEMTDYIMQVVSDGDVREGVDQVGSR